MDYFKNLIFLARLKDGFSECTIANPNTGEIDLISIEDALEVCKDALFSHAIKMSEEEMEED